MVYFCDRFMSNPEKYRQECQNPKALDKHWEMPVLAAYRNEWRVRIRRFVLNGLTEEKKARFLEAEREATERIAKETKAKKGTERGNKAQEKVARKQ